MSHEPQFCHIVLLLCWPGAAVFWGKYQTKLSSIFLDFHFPFSLPFPRLSKSFSISLLQSLVLIHENISCSSSLPLQVRCIVDLILGFPLETCNWKMARAEVSDFIGMYKIWNQHNGAEGRGNVTASWNFRKEWCSYSLGSHWAQMNLV